MDLSQYSDEQLMQMAEISRKPSAPDLSQYSDEDLAKMAGVPLKQDTPGFIDRVGNDLSNRGDIVKQQLLGAATGQQGLPETALNILGKGGAGAVQDIIGEGVNAVVPDFVKQGVSSGAQKLADVIDSTKAGQAIGDTAMNAQNSYSKFEQNNPRISNVVDSLVNIASVAPLKEGVQAGGNMLADTGKAIMDSADAKSVAKQVGSNELKQWSRQAYKAAEDAGGNIAPDVTNKWLDSAINTMPQTNEGKLALGETSATKFTDRVQALRDKPLSFQAAEEIDKGLGAEINKAYRAGDKEEALKFEGIQDGLRDAVASLPEASEHVTQAKGLWSAAARQREIENILKRADQTDNPATTIKTGFRTLSNNERRMAGYTNEERALINKAAQTGVVTDALKTFGSRLIPIMTLGAGGGIGEAIAAKTLSSVSRSGATALQSGRAAKVINAINQRPAVQNAIKAATASGELQPQLTAEKAIGGALNITGQALNGDLLRQIMSMPPAQAREALSKLKP